MAGSTKRIIYRTGIALVSALVLLYSLAIAQQILLGLIVVLGFWLCYLVYLVAVRLGRIETTLEQMADRSTDGPTKAEFTRG